MGQACARLNKHVYMVSEPPALFRGFASSVVACLPGNAKCTYPPNICPFFP